jgi:hypothetical protein
MPIALVTTCSYSPSVFPITVRTAALIPWPSVLATMNVTLGPGMMMMTAVSEDATNRLLGSKA